MEDNGSQEAIGMGTILIRLHTSHITKVPYVLHVPYLTKNLMSICKATQGEETLNYSMIIAW
jgi:hypothetical protein